MPHTTTKNLRTKRPDTRPNEKQRRKLSRKIEESKTIQDIRVTRKRKFERKERVVTSEPQLNQSTLTEDDKVLRALKKKMRKIDNLISRQKAGETLDEQQLESIESLDDVVAQMNTYLNSLKS
mmetsp:Transcript_9044/g.13590  ORF Transcript_9044/g.13590 Transcript_9044/m.13590 type:complete len:123 (-) Transcript_9044:91-459(-)|eukprot:CAMPEP_0185034624 /NCGR_PEP_ID=MMETSP1103-20130426/24686_1 /TAXON_ID=36769 /ORGANISM="Paraphysomonas bandaiensis, Strain Caron Lab Isolate" /LENGTH=122 /DNA_ID=CAMNT_0027571359 /DNA_START=45 /DNA_END=413 /DNA_ORIENTATION=+